MPVFLIFCLIVLFSQMTLQISLPSFLASLSLPFHEACLSFSPHSLHVDLYRAMVCGADPSSHSIQRDFAQTGLIHLLVVSGSHLVVLESSLKFMTNRWPATSGGVSVVLGLFVLATRAEPPILRAWFYWLARSAARRYRLNWSPTQTVVLSFFVGMNFCATASDLRSLLLSSVAALAIHGFSTPPTSRDEKHSWQKTLSSGVALQIRVYLLLTPLLLPLALPHPTSIFANLMIGPILGGALFPASLLAFLIAPFTPAVDLLWSLVILAVRTLAQHIPQSLETVHLSLAVQLAYFVLIAMLSLIWERTKREQIDL